jgi:Ca2+-binding RTX toxin-like protein
MEDIESATFDNPVDILIVTADEGDWVEVLDPENVDRDLFIRAGDGNDIVMSGSGDDDIHAGTDTSTNFNALIGHDGDDTLNGSTGTDLLMGDYVDGESASFSDFIKQWTENSRLKIKSGVGPKGNGEDKLFGGDGIDFLSGGPGDDEIDAGTGLGSVIFGDGYHTGTNIDIDLNEIFTGSESILTKAGPLWEFFKQFFEQASSPVSVNLEGDGNDTITSAAAIDIIFGNGGDDKITKTSGGSLILGNDGRDTIDTSAAFSTIALGGDKDDHITVSSHSDVVLGGEGWDKIFGGDGLIDVLIGDGYAGPIPAIKNFSLDLMKMEFKVEAEIAPAGSGNDNIFGEAGNDLIIGGDGDDFLDSGFADPGPTRPAGDFLQFLQEQGEVAMRTFVFDVGSVIFGDAVTIGVDKEFDFKDEQSQQGSGDGDSGGSRGGGADSDPQQAAAEKFNLAAFLLSLLQYTGSGNDKIFGSSGFDWIYGQDGNDEIDTRGGLADIAYGDNGNDSIDATDTHFSWLVGGEGNDTLEAAAFGSNQTASVMIGDTFQISEFTSPDLGFSFDWATRQLKLGADIGGAVSGGNGDDTMIAPTGINFMMGGDGNDTIEGGGIASIMFGDSLDLTLGGDLILNFSPNTSIIQGGLKLPGLQGGGNDTIKGIGAGLTVVIAGAGDDTVIGGASTDVIWGNDGNDTIKGGNDIDAFLISPVNIMFGGNGDDTVNGGAGRNIIFGDSLSVPAFDQAEWRRGVLDFRTGIAGSGSGNDDISGGYNSFDLLVGGSGDDRISGNFALFETSRSDGLNIMIGDEIQATSGFRLNLLSLFSLSPWDAVMPVDPNWLHGGGNDAITGGSGEDWVYSGGGIDLVRTFAGQDYIQTDDGYDTVFAGAGKDEIRTGTGADHLDGGRDIDNHFGGPQGDVFVYDERESEFIIPDKTDFYRLEGDTEGAIMLDPGGPYEIDEPEGEVRFYATATHPDGLPVHIDWDLDNNGTYDVIDSVSALEEFSGEDGPDNLPIRVRAYDDEGGETVMLIYVYVRNLPPLIESTPARYDVTPGQAVNLQASATDSGDDDMTYTWEITTGGIGAVATGANAWWSPVAHFPNVTGRPPYTIAGVLKVKDEDGGESSKNFSIVISAPAAAGEGEAASEETTLASALDDLAHDVAGVWEKYQGGSVI